MNFRNEAKQQKSEEAVNLSNKMSLKIKNSKKEGKGVFAGRNFKKGETVFEFKGKTVGWKKATHRSIQIGKSVFINPSKSNPGYFLNHSCNPNCGLRNLADITAMRNIKNGEEITIDYSTNISVKWYMECLCSSKKCRKVITSYTLLPHAVKKKYKGWISEYMLADKK